MGGLLEVLIPFFSVLFLLVVVHEFGHFAVAKLFKMLVEEFGFGMPPRIGGIKFGETLYSINWLPIGGFVKIYGEDAEEQDEKNSKEKSDRAFHSRPWWQQGLVILAGPAMNILLAVLILTVLFTKGTYIPSTQVRVLSVQERSPAFIAGIQKNDVITDITHGEESFRIQLMTDLTKRTKEFAGKALTMRIVREGKPLVVSATPRVNPPKGQGSLGVEISQFEYIKVPWYQAPVVGMREALRMSKEFYSELFRAGTKLITFQNPQVEVTGPVGIAKITGNAAKSGSEVLWMFIALFSLNLALINLIPFPALDGGQLMFVLYEAITGKPVKPKVRAGINGVGFILLISLMLVITFGDVRKLFFP